MQLRAAYHLRLSDRIEEAMAYLRPCLKSQRVSIRAFAVAILVHSEHDVRTQHPDADIDRIHPAMSTLEQQLEAVRVSGDTSDFALETEVFLRYNLCSLYSGCGQYAQALQCAAEAIYLSLPLGTPNLTSMVRMSYALAAMLTGDTVAALREYQSVLNGATTNPRQRLYSSLNISLIHLMHGNTRRAESNAEVLLATQPHSPQVQATRQFVRAFAGKLGPDEEIVDLAMNDMEVTIRTLQRLANTVTTHTEDNYHELLGMLSEVTSRDARAQTQLVWLQVYTLLKMGRPYLAAQRLQKTHTAYPLIDALLGAARLDIALSRDDLELEPTARSCEHLQALFARVPSREDRLGLAETLTFWHPTASAFLAMSPYSVPELVDTAMPAVFKDGRPITVYGRAIPTRLPFVQLSLSAFGIDATVHRDQSVERERMNRVLTVPWGEGTRVLPAIPPAWLVYHLLRVAHDEGGIWRAAALELARSHGMVPKTLGGHLRTERAVLSNLLEDLMHRTLTPVEFLRRLDDLHLGRARA